MPIVRRSVALLITGYLLAVLAFAVAAQEMRPVKIGVVDVPLRRRGRSVRRAGA